MMPRDDLLFSILIVTPFMNWAALGLSGIRRVLVRVIDLAEAGCSAPVRVLRSVPS